MEPPATVITLNGFIINNETYVENTTTNKKAAAWMNISPKLGHEIIPGRIYEDDEEASGGGNTGSETTFANAVKLGRPREQGPKDVDMARDDVEEDRATKRKVGPEETAKPESGATAQDENAQLVKRLLAKLDEKDEQISKMMATIEALRVQIQTMNDALTLMSTKESEL